MGKDYEKHQENVEKFIWGVLVIIAYSIVLAQFRADFIDTLMDLMGGPEYLPLLTRIFFASPIWLYLIINCISPFLLVLTWAFWKRRYRRVLLVLLMLLTGLSIVLYGVALYLPKITLLY